MVDGDLFDKLAEIACIIRKTFKPFGGIQVDLQNLPSSYFRLLILSIGYCNGRFFPTTASNKGLQSSQIRI